MAPSATPGGSPGASASSTSSQSAAPPSPLKAARRPAPFSTSFLSLVSATLGGPSVDEFGVGARVWVAHADGSATSATVLAAPQPRSGRCVVREDGRAPAQYHASQLSAAAPARRDDRAGIGALAEGDRCLLRSASEGDAPQPCVVVSRPNGQGRCVVRVARGYAGGADRACRLVHAGQLELVDGSFLDDVSRELAPGLLFGECRAYPEAAAKDAADATEDRKEAPPPRYAPADDPDYGPYYRMLKVGAPPAAIAQKMARDGRDARRIEATEPFFVEGSGGAPAAAAGAPGGSVAALFGGGGGGLPAPKRAPKRRLTVKQLPLDFHAAVGEDSIWADVHALNGIEVHRPELEKLFVKAAADKRDAPTARKAVKKVKDGARVVVLNPKRSTNVAIALSGSKLTALAPAVVAAALERLDAAAFTRTQLDALDAAAPQADEVASLEKCAAGDDDFGRYAEAERFMCRVALPMGARLYADRVAALRYRGGFDDRAAALRGAASRLRAGCAEVTASPSLKKLLTYVLRLSSELADAKRFEFGSPGGAGADGGDDRAGAAGFKMASLLKLADTKAFDRETSALEYLVDALRRSGDEPAADGPEAAAAAAAAGASARAALAGRPPADDAGAARAAHFHDMASSVLRELALDVEAAAEAFLDTLAYFHEDGGQTPAEFFSTLVATHSAVESEFSCDDEDLAELRDLALY
ncbi:hypothetical protein SO694_00007056 [Aureococcus anophagefferens]|uniref:FH2 domain-containing protein n=1 Tax=Aureococcus anophagefferens TaxID=44056 RepID=A0ABR1GAH2_AURAN